MKDLVGVELRDVGHENLVAGGWGTFSSTSSTFNSLLEQLL